MLIKDVRYILMKKSISIIIMFLISFPLFSEPTKESVYQTLLKKFSKVNSVQLNFTMHGNNSFKGTLKAKKGNKHIIKMPAMTVISNGSTIWNLNEKDSKVMISNYEKNSKGAFSIDKFFFSFISDYLPENLTKLKNPSTGKYYEMSFTAKDKSKSGQAGKFKLILDKSCQSISSVEFDDNGTLRKFDVSKLKINPKLADAVFNYKAPKGIEIIDLR